LRALSTAEVLKYSALNPFILINKEDRSMLFEGYVVAKYGTDDESIVYKPEPIMADSCEAAGNTFLIGAYDAIIGKSIDPEDVRVLVRPFE
jgi:hypothetical protein